MLLDAGWGPETGPELAWWMEPQRGEAWINHRGAFLEECGLGLTNVLALRPPGNQLDQLCCTKADLPAGYSWPSLARTAYLRPEYLSEVDRLQQELFESKPNLVICAGNTACWALLRATNIGQIRGSIVASGRHFAEPGLKCLPTYHPAGVLRSWSWRPIVVADLIKARREAEFPEIRRPQRQVLVNPTIQEMQRWVSRTLRTGAGDSLTASSLACDIETGSGQVKCVGFASSPTDALVIPFVDFTCEGGSYWATPADERFAWDCVQELLGSGIPLVFQNGLYDLQYLLRLGLRPANLAEDTMLLHHSLYPELQKGLGFLGSIYTSEASWKLMRRVRPDSEKRDE